jgi:hypothetical protein
VVDSIFGIVLQRAEVVVSEDKWIERNVTVNGTVELNRTLVNNLYFRKP